MEKFKLLAFVLVVLILYTCKATFNGFKVKNLHEDYHLPYFDSLRLKRKVIYTGYFIDVTYNECKEISFFYPYECGFSTKEPDYKSIVKYLKDNNPSNWPFYYCPYTWENTLGIVRIRDTNNVERRVDFFWTGLNNYIDDSVNFNFRNEKVGKYVIRWAFFRNISFWESECTASSLNKYLTRRRNFVSTSNQKYYKCNVPYYYFIDDNKISVLLPDSIM